MAHDHNEKTHYCGSCGYWHIATRFEIWECPKCKKELTTYASKEWIINNVDKKFKKIPDDKIWNFGSEGFVND